MEVKGSNGPLTASSPAKIRRAPRATTIFAGAPRLYAAFSGRVERDGAGREEIDRDDVERAGVRRPQDDRRRAAGALRLQPPGRAYAPAVAGLQAGEAPLGARRRKVVPGAFAEDE